MATVQEIERAIERLPETERNALESRLLARRCGLSSLNDEEQAELLRSLGEAERFRAGERATQVHASTSPSGARLSK